MRNNIIRSTLVAAAVAGAFLVIASAKSTSQNVPCKESLEKSCCKKSKGGSNNMIWETLPGQFFTYSSLN